MKQILHSSVIKYLIFLLLIGCNKENDPTYLMPQLSINTASNITRTSADLNGEIKIIGNGEVSVARFLYGTTTDMQYHIDCIASVPKPSITIQGLKPNTTYYYCLEAGNDIQTIRSEMGEFTTAPNTIPQICPLQRLSQGPLSITLQISIADNGGEELTEVGFYYKKNEGEEKKLSISTTDQTRYTYRIGNLEQKTSYIIQAYAKNSMGESRSESYSFQTQQAIIITKAGTLSDAIDENEKYLFEELSISGPLNGTDIRILRDMLGRDIDGNETNGKLAHLNLTDADIYEGGLSYDYNRYTFTNHISSGMFADCPHLKTIHLPHKTIKIEENAFENCILLQSIYIPANTSKIYPSEGCNKLENFYIDTGNNYFKSYNGILYDQSIATLLWAPEGITDIDEIPNSVIKIGDYAFRNSKLTEIILPNKLEECGIAAFYGASIEQIKLPDSLKYINDALFQHCNKLKVIRFGENVEKLGEYCFDGCPLEELHVRTSDFPPMCTNNTFTGIEQYLETCTLYVPKGNKKIYQNDNHWGIFSLIVEE